MAAQVSRYQVTSLRVSLPSSWLWVGFTLRHTLPKGDKTATTTCRLILKKCSIISRKRGLFLNSPAEVLTQTLICKTWVLDPSLEPGVMSTHPTYIESEWEKRGSLENKGAITR